MQRSPQNKILVLGAGHFGTCLAQHLTTNGHDVEIWTRDEDVCQSINNFHLNNRYLTSVHLSPHIHATSHVSQEMIDSVDVILLALPTQVLRDVLQNQIPKPRVNKLIVCAAKGIEMGSLKLPLHIVGASWGSELIKNAVVLSGPSFAIEVAQGQPTGVSVASQNVENAIAVQNIFHSPRFRVYTSNDPVGLEVAGALKNVVAIASGACAGLGFQANCRATLITRGLAEMTRVGVAMGANPLTFNGLGGVGDLFLTCTSEKSRNFTVGYRLGKGEHLEHVLSTVGSVAEGVTTAKSAYELGQSLKVATPISDAVYQVIYEKKNIDRVVHELMTRDAKDERE